MLQATSMLASTTAASCGLRDHEMPSPGTRSAREASSPPSHRRSLPMFPSVKT